MMKIGNNKITKDPKLVYQNYFLYYPLKDFAILYSRKGAKSDRQHIRDHQK